MERNKTVTVIGAGALGAAMASRLGETGHVVRLWNRTPERARSAAESALGVTAVESLDSAVSGASVIITVLRDGDAVTQVMEGAVAHLDNGAVWVQASTVGPRSSLALADLASKNGVDFLDAPVSGSSTPALKGKLIWLISGDEDVLTRVRSVLDALASSVLHVGTGVEGSSLKLAVNAWMTASTVAMSDVLGLCDALNIKHESLVAALEAGPLNMRYALQKLRLMDDETFKPGFAVQLALKDIDLAGEYATLSPLLQVVHDRLKRTATAGYGEQDLAAIDIFRATP
jgi:3-hydroxyisobutyrate dehydrogenase